MGFIEKTWGDTLGDGKSKRCAARIQCDFCGAIVLKGYMDRYETNKFVFCNKYCRAQASSKNVENNVVYQNFVNVCLEKYGVDNPMKCDEIKDKIDWNKAVETYKTNFQNKYGVDFPMQLEENKIKSKETCLEKYGVEHVAQAPIVKRAIIETNLEKYGVEHTFQVKEFKDKSEQTMLIKYGASHSMQVQEIFERAQRNKLTGYKKGYYFSTKNNKNIWYDSSYELKALQLLENNNKVLLFDRAHLVINYLDNKKECVYYPDFIAKFKNSKKNVVIEVKPAYKLKDRKEKLKFRAGRKFCKYNNMLYKIWSENELDITTKNYKKLKND